MNNINQNNIPAIKLKSIVLDCPDVQALSDFIFGCLDGKRIL